MDIIKRTLINGYEAADIGIESVFVALLVTLVIAVYIFIIYRSITSKTFYSKNFNISLVGVSLITTTIIATIQASLVVSLGMVGALSIVRFRTAIKNPMDLMFLFWAISVGIICGAGHAVFAIELSMILTIAVMFLEWIPVKKAPMILIINCDDVNAEERVNSCLKKYSKHFTVKSRNMTSERLDMTIELRTDEAANMLKELINVSGVMSANLLQHDGEVTF